MLVLFLQLFFILATTVATVAGVVALEVHFASVIRSRWDRAAMKRRYILHVLLCLRQIAMQPPALQKKSLIALHDEGVLNVHPEGFTYQGLLRWFYRQLDRKGRRATAWKFESRRRNKFRIALSPNRLSAEAPTAAPV